MKKVKRYLDAVSHFGKDKCFNPDEVKSLQELKSNLGLTDEDLKNANNEELLNDNTMEISDRDVKDNKNICIDCGKKIEVSGLKKYFGNQTVCPVCKAEKDKKIQRYLDAVKLFGKDKYLTPDEEKTLQELKLNLGLADDDIKKANDELNKLQLSTKKTNITICDQKVAVVSSDKQITPKEELELAELMNSLAVSESDLPDKTRQTLSDARLLASLAQGVLPTLQVVILLKPGEVCHFLTPARLQEEFTKTRYVGGSHGASFRVAKGVTIRTGSYRRSPIKERYEEITDNGILYVTNKKVLFVGERKNVSYPINKIVNVNKFTDAIQFQKENESNASLLLNQSKKPY